MDHKQPLRGRMQITLQLGYFSICQLAEEKTLAIHSHF